MTQYPHSILIEEGSFIAQVNSNNLFQKLGKAVQAYFPSGATKAIITGAQEIITQKDTPQASHRAFELILNALNNAGAKLLQSEKHRLKDSIINKQDLLKFKIKGDINSAQLHIKPDFFDDPEKLSLLKPFTVWFKDWLEWLGFETSIAEKLKRKLPDAFFKEVIKEWGRKRDYYQCIEEAFESPFAKAWERKYYTLKYQDELREMVHEPAMGDELLPLSKIYIKPYFTIHDRSCGKKLGERDKDGFVKELPIYETIHHYIEQRIIYNKQPLDLEVEKNNLIFLLGQPGQGKSSFCLYTLNQLLEHPDFDKQIYFVRLKDLSDTRELINRPFDSIKEYIKENHQLGFSEDNSVLVLDGLDEIYQREGLSDKELEGFYHKLEHRSERKKGLTIILTSRYNYLTISAIGKKTATILKLKGLVLAQQKRWLSIYINIHQDCKLSLSKLTEINKNPKLRHIEELIEQPILLHIVASAKIDINAKLNRSTIYKDLFDALIKRSWDKKKGQLKKYENLANYADEFREWLQEIAFNIYKSDFEYIQRQALLNLSSTKIIKSRLITSDDFNDAQKDLLVAFYFKNSKVDKKDSSVDDKEEYAIEFLHKSLQEYLATEYIWNTIKEEILLKKRRGKFVIDNFKEVLKLFSDLFARKELNESTRSLLVQMVENTTKEDKQALGDRLKFFLPDCMEHQFLYKYDLSSDSELTHLGNPFDKALNTFYGYWLIFSHLGLNKNLLPIDHRSNFIHLIRKYSLPINLHKINLAGANLIRAYLKGANLRRSILKETDLRHAILKGADLRKSDLRHTVLRYAHLIGANFSGADLSRANLSQANLSEANLNQANLSGANLSQANLSGANLTKANLSGANLTKANLNQANLNQANLNQANLSQANLSQANLSKANLAKANLEETILVRAMSRRAILSEVTFVRALLLKANFNGADLRNANFMGAQLQSANFKGADLRNAIFIETQLQSANFKGADLRNAILKEADLSRANLSKANLTSTNLSEANLSRVYLRNAILKGAILISTNFNEADLMGSVFANANFKEANLRRANLRGADLRSTNLTGVNLSEADLIGANLSEANWGEVNLRETKVHSVDFIKKLTEWNCHDISKVEKNYYVDPQKHYYDWDYNKEQPYYLIKEK